MASKKTKRARGLTPLGLKALRAKSQRYAVSDAGVHSGLRAEVLPSGQIVFRWTAWENHKTRLVTIAPWSEDGGVPGSVSLSRARDYLARLKAANRSGALDAELAKVEYEIKAGAAAQGRTVGDVADEFYKNRIEPHRRRPEQALRILEKDIKRKLGHIPIRSLTKVQCGELISEIVRVRKSPAMAGDVLGMLGQLTRYAESVGYVDYSVASNMDPKNYGITTGAAKRALDPKEVPLLLKALGETHYPKKSGMKNPRSNRTAVAPDFGLRAAFEIILLTGCRPGEICQAEWAEVDIEDDLTWTIPLAKQKLSIDEKKGRQPFVIPLSPRVVDLFRKIKEQCPEKCAWVLPGRDKKDHVAVQALDKAMYRMQTKDPALLALPGERITPHDLRRTARTFLSARPVSATYEVAERALNHALPNLAAIYDKNDYLDERKDAMNKLADFIASLEAQAKRPSPPSSTSS